MNNESDADDFLAMMNKMLKDFESRTSNNNIAKGDSDFQKNTIDFEEAIV